MKRRILATILAAASAAALATGLHASQDEGFFFRSSNTGVLPYAVGTENPGDPGEEVPGALEATADIPDELPAGTEITFSAEASGGTGGPYVWQAVNAPSFMEVSPDGEVTLRPGPEDVGSYEGIELIVNDGESFTVVGPFSFHVLGTGGVRPSMPSAAWLDGEPFDWRTLFDGRAGAGSMARLDGGTILEYLYDEPVTATGVYVRSGSGNQRGLAFEAYVDGEWAEFGRTGSSYSGTVSLGGETTSDRWRVSRWNPSSSFTNLHEFRPGPSPQHRGPAFTTRGGWIAMKGQSVQIEATMQPSAYHDGSQGPFFEFVEEEVPAGVELSASGLLEVGEEAEFAGTFTFSVKASDPVGFDAVRSFYVTADAPDADSVMASDFMLDGVPLDRRPMYDGDTVSEADAVISGSSEMVVDFGHPVRATAVTFGFDSVIMSGTARAVLEAEHEGGWTEIGQYSRNQGGRRTFPQFTSSRFRVTSLDGSAVAINELRIGGGPAHAAPSFSSHEYLATLGPDETETVIEAVADGHYSDPAVSFSVIDGSLPGGVELAQDGTAVLPSADQADGLGWGWNFTVRAVDQEGFETEKAFWVGSSSAEASQTYPSAARQNGAASGALLSSLYDGDDDTSGSTSHASPIIVEFPYAVRFDSLYVDASGASEVHVRAPDGSWTLAATPVTSSRVVSLDRAYVSGAVRIRPTSTTGTISVRQFRPGNGPAAPAPVIESVAFSLSDDPVQAVLEASRFDDHYVDAEDAELVWSASGLPDGIYLDPEGVLHLPAAATVEWDVLTLSLRVTDGLGKQGNADVVVSNPFGVADARYIMASAAYRTTASPTAYDPERFYDGQSHAGPTITEDIAAEFHFDRLVSFSSYELVKTGSTGYVVEAFVDGGWTIVDEGTGAGTLSSDLDTTFVSDRVRIRRTSGSTTRIDKFRLGKAPVYVAPQVPRYFLSLAAEPTSPVLNAVSDAHFRNREPGWEIVSGQLPSGASLEDDGTLNLPAFTAEPGTWVATARFTDAAGVSAETQVVVASPEGADAAAQTLPVLAQRVGGMVFDPWAFHSGDTAANDSRITSRTLPIELDFGHTVRFDSYYIHRMTSNEIRLMVETENGDWADLDMTDTSVIGARPLPLEVATRRVRLVPDATGNHVVRQFRPGNGPVYTHPAVSTGRYLGLVTDGDISVQLQAAIDPNYGHAGEWSLLSSTLPDSPQITPTGMLTVPAPAPGESLFWEIQAAVHDGNVLSQPRDFLVTSGAPVFSVRPEVRVDGQALSAGAVNTLAQNSDTNNLISTAAGTEIVFDFGEPVIADEIWIRFSASSRAFEVEAEVDGTWQAAVPFSTSDTAMTGYHFGAVEASRFRVTSLTAGHIRQMSVGLRGIPWTP